MDPISLSTSLLSPADLKVGSDKPSGGAGSGEAEGGFGAMLAEKIGGLGKAMQEADAASQALATGQATDVSSVVMQVEKASLELQLASQIRNKAVEAYHELFRMQI